MSKGKAVQGGGSGGVEVGWSSAEEEGVVALM